jgi:hypothetical protein
VYEGGMFVFGGKRADMEEYLGDLWRLDLAALEWTRQHPAGVAPCARGELAAATLHGRRVFIYGGYAETSSGSLYMDLCLQVVMAKKKKNNNRWCALSTATDDTSACPGPRAGCALLADSVHNRLVLVGGYNSMRTQLSGEGFSTGETGDTWVLSEVPRGAGGGGRGEKLQKQSSPWWGCTS